MKAPIDLFGVECGPGWRSLIEPLIAQCKAEGAHILQIKEKFGGLRFYVDGASEDLRAAIDKAEEQSFFICEECGQPGKCRSGGWIRTLCDAHADRKYPPDDAPEPEDAPFEADEEQENKR